jgi:hypothetical protein
MGVWAKIYRCLMEAVWTVERNTGSLAHLVNGKGTKQVERPQAMSRQEFFSLLAPGSIVEDDSLSILWKA